MSCCGHCQDAGDFFNDRTAKRELKKYRRRGPEKSTRLLIESIPDQAAENSTLLDIGGGIGAIQFELFRKGLHHSINVDASQAYQAVSKKEAAKRKLSEKTDYHFGDFTEVAPALSKADIVTLDKVICCYPDMDLLLKTSLEKTGSYYGLIFPRENLFTRIGFKLVNFWFKIRRSEFRTYLHPHDKVEEVIRSYGFREKKQEKTILWRVLLYEKTEK